MTTKKGVMEMSIGTVVIIAYIVIMLILFILFMKSACEPVEVDEIEIWNGLSWDCRDTRECYPRCSDGCYYNWKTERKENEALAENKLDKCTYDCLIKCCSKNSIIISKQDLTIEWLDEQMEKQQTKTGDEK